MAGDDDEDEAGPTEGLALGEAVTRVVVLGDPHGCPIGLDLALEREEGPTTTILSAGDNIGYADAAASSAFVAALAARGIRSVRGNHEAWSRGGRLFLGPPGAPRDLTPAARAWCEALPGRLVVTGPRLAAPVHLVHALPGWDYPGPDTAERLLDLEGAPVVVCGHSHRPAIYAFGPGALAPEVHRLDPTAAAPVVVPWDPRSRYVVDAGSLGRPDRPRGRAVLERGTYAAFDLVARTLSLHAVDKRPRLRALWAHVLGGPGRSGR